MVRVLAIGDSHIPQRAKKVPEQIISKLNQITNSGKFDFILFTGDVIKAPDFLNFLKDLTKNEIIRVIGNMDYYSGYQDAPVYQKISISLEKHTNLIIGLIHGHQISPRGDLSQLESLAIEKSNNILISGHTHQEEVILTKKNILLLNPGSVTGAWSFIASRNPSFIVIEINIIESNIDITLYQYDIRATILNNLRYNYSFQNQKIYTK
jgi:putative phosphoesterase